MDSATGFLNTYPLDSDLSGGISYAGRHLSRFWTRFNGFILMWQATAIFENPNVILKTLLNPSDSFFLLTRRSLYSMFALRLANFAMKLLWIIWNSTYKFCWNDFNNALTEKLKYCCSFRFTKMWLFAYDAFPFLTTSSNHDFTILRDSFDLQEYNLWLRLVQLLLLNK